MKWAVYGIAAVTLGVIALLRGDIRKTLFAAMIVALQAEVNLTLGTPERASYLGSSGPTSLFVPMVALMGGICLVLHLVTGGLEGRRFKWTCGGLTIPGTLYVLTTAATIFYAPEKRPVLYYLQFPLYGYVMCLVAVNFVQSAADASRVRNLLLIVLVTQSLVYYIENVTGVTFTLTGDVVTPFEGSGMARHGGTVGTNPNGFAMFMSPLTYLALATFLTTASRWLKRASAVALVAGLVAIVLTFTRAAWFGLAVGSLVILWVGARRHRIAWRRLAIILVLGLLPLLALLPMVMARVNEDHAAAYEERARLSRIAWRIIDKNVLGGVGAAAYPMVMRQYLLPEERSKWLFIVHNYFLLRWAETGLFGVLSFCLIMAAGLRMAGRCTRSPDESIAAIGLAWYAGVLHLCWSLWWENSLGGAGYLFWFMNGLVQAAGRIGTPERADKAAVRAMTPAGAYGAVA